MNSIITILVFVLFFIPSLAFAQFSVPSSSGYTVNVNLTPNTIVPNNNPCPWGYNYNLNFSWNISYTGTPPASLYILESRIYCNSDLHFYSLPLPGSNSTGTVTTGQYPWRNATDCATATVSSLNCSVFNLHISGPGIADQYINATIVLPIELISFNAEVKQTNVNLDWHTASEINNDFFTIERSVDGTEWEVLGNIDGAGNSTHVLSYNYVDDSPLLGQSYYRLKQTDFDGKYTYSTPVTVDFKEAETVVANVKNPVMNDLTFDYYSSQNNMIQVKITDLSGRILATETKRIDKGNQQLGIDVAKLAKGIYVVTLNSSNPKNASAFKIVKE